MFTSNLYCAEAVEDELRVTRGKRRYAPENFFVPVDQLIDEPASVPDFRPSQRPPGDTRSWMRELFTRSAMNIVIVYQKALDDDRLAILEFIPFVVREMVKDGSLTKKSVGMRGARTIFKLYAADGAVVAREISTALEIAH